MLFDMIGLLLSPQQTRVSGVFFVRPHVVVHPAYLCTREAHAQQIIIAICASIIHCLPGIISHIHWYIQLAFFIAPEAEEPIRVVHTIRPTYARFYCTCVPTACSQK